MLSGASRSWSNAEWFSRLRDRDTTAVTAIYRQVVKICHNQLTAWPEVGEDYLDICHDVLVAKLLPFVDDTNNLARIHGSFVGYASQIINNYCFEIKRRIRRERSITGPAADAPEALGGIKLSREVILGDSARIDQRQRKLRQALAEWHAELSPTDQTIVSLLLMDESRDWIGRQCDPPISGNNVGVRIHRFGRKLRRKLIEHGFWGDEERPRLAGDGV